MTELKKKVKLALDETRLLVLGAQILLGFQYRSVIQPAFDLLPHASQVLKIFALLGMLLTTLLMMWPASFHQIAGDGEVTGGVHRFCTFVMCLALFPFALVLGAEVYTVAQMEMSQMAAIALATVVIATALFAWYGVELIAISQGHGAKERRMTDQQQRQPAKPTELFDKIDHVLTECRVVIPGAQALLGFQFIAMLTEGFTKLPKSSQYVHLAALLLIGMSMVLLMTPAAYHRIVEAGESSEGFWRLARRMLLWAMGILAIGLAAEFYVVSVKALLSVKLSLIISIGALFAFYAAWFGYPLVVCLKKKAQVQ